jgi:hypothetical protein
MPDWLAFSRWLGSGCPLRSEAHYHPEGIGEAEGAAVGVAVGAGELAGWDSVTVCDEICSSSFHCPPSFKRLHTMTKRGVPVLSTKETSTVAVAVVPKTPSTCKEWMVELCIS